MKIAGVKCNMSFDLGEIEISIPEVVQAMKADHEISMENKRFYKEERLSFKDEEKRGAEVIKNETCNMLKDLGAKFAEVIKQSVAEGLKGKKNEQK